MRFVKVVLALLLVVACAGIVSANTDLTASFRASHTVVMGGAVNGDMSLTSTSTGNITRYQWFVDGYPFGENAAVVGMTWPWVTAPEAHTISLRVYEGKHYVDSLPLAIIVNPMPIDTPTPSPAPESHARSTIGIYRQSTGYWFLNKDNTGTVAKSFRFGTQGDIPVAGDFNGDGKMDTAVFRPSTGMWYVDENSNSKVDISEKFGTAGDVPLAGDFNADGNDDIVVFRPSSGMWYIDTNHDGKVDIFFHFGTAGDVPVIK